MVWVLRTKTSQVEQQKLDPLLDHAAARLVKKAMDILRAQIVNCQAGAITLQGYRVVSTESLKVGVLRGPKMNNALVKKNLKRIEQWFYRLAWRPMCQEAVWARSRPSLLAWLLPGLGSSPSRPSRRASCRWGRQSRPGG